MKTKTTKLILAAALAALFAGVGVAGLLDSDSESPPDRAAKAIRAEAAATLDLLVARYNGLMGVFWDTPGATPEQVLDSLGDDGASLFQYGALLKGFILSVKPDASLTPIPPYVADVQFAQSGSATIVRTGTQ